MSGSSSSSSRPRRPPETKSMGLARYRNQLEERSLGRRLEVLSSRCIGRCNKLRAEMDQLHDRLKMMSPVPGAGGGGGGGGGGKPVICPKGLTESEKEQYRKLRRNSYTPSMTLEEFDLRLTDYRQVVTAYRRASLPANNHPLEEYVFQDAGIVDLEEHEFCAPLTKHKHTMKEALKRATATTPKATDVSPQFVHKSRARSESSAAATMEYTSSGAPVFPSNYGKPFRRRSTSHPQVQGGTQDPVLLQETPSVIAAPSTSGTSRRTSARPLTACGSPSSAKGSANRVKFAPRCQSATAGRRHRQGASSQREIRICPDYIATRRMSVDVEDSQTGLGIDIFF